MLMLSAGLVLLLPSSRLKTVLSNGLLWLAGAVGLVLAVIGAILPVMPTVPFLLITFTCWAKASPRFHAWLYRHPKFGKMMRDWQERRGDSATGQVYGLGDDVAVVHWAAAAFSRALVCGAERGGSVFVRRGLYGALSRCVRQPESVFAEKPVNGSSSCQPNSVKS